MTRILLIENEFTLHWFESPGSLLHVQKALKLGDFSATLCPKDLEIVMRVSKTTPVQMLQTGNLLVLIPVGSLTSTNQPDQTTTELCLTRRQTQVLQALINGLSTKQIASLLQLSERTVLLHIHILKERMGVQTREQIILKALSSGLV